MPQPTTDRTAGRPEKKPFVVGRLTRRATAVVILDRRRAPLPGPWTLQAVVSPRG